MKNRLIYYACIVFFYYSEIDIVTYERQNNRLHPNFATWQQFEMYNEESKYDASMATGFCIAE
jgi:hypothetical protein